MKSKIFALITLTFLLIDPAISLAQSLSITLAPPFVQVGLAPGDYWPSSLKVVNTNETNLPIYASVMNFEASGESGNGDFFPISDESFEKKSSLGSWIEINQGPYNIPPGQSGEIPFAIRVPKDAAPGGHYAAVLVGARPFSESPQDGPSVKVSSFISALIFVRISGDIVESGMIREFSTDKAWYESPDAKITLRFENTGNVHIQPQGSIVISDIWGREAVKIPVNDKTDLGNVLPKSIRKFEFSWQGKEGVSSFGRYKAEATLGYGKDVKQNSTRITYFWVVPLKEILTVLGGVIAVAIFMVWRIKKYIRRTLEKSLGQIVKREDRTPKENVDRHLGSKGNSDNNSIDLRRK